MEKCWLELQNGKLTCNCVERARRDSHTGLAGKVSASGKSKEHRQHDGEQIMVGQICQQITADVANMCVFVAAPESGHVNALKATGLYKLPTILQTLGQSVSQSVCV